MSHSSSHTKGAPKHVGDDDDWATVKNPKGFVDTMIPMFYVISTEISHPKPADDYSIRIFFN